MDLLEDDDRVPFRATGWRVPPHGWARNIGPWLAVFILLFWPSLLVASWLGPLLLAVVIFTVWNLTTGLRARRDARRRTE